MKKNHHYAWQATCVLGDYFSRLGGSARPRNMRESEIATYIICKILETNSNNLDVMKYIDKDFLDASLPVLDKTDSYLTQLSLQSEKLISFTTEFYEHINSKLKFNDKSSRWEALGLYLKKQTATNQ